MDEDAIADLFGAFGPVAVRRMFGGLGLYADGVMFALVADGVIYLKADEAFAAELATRGAAPFSYGTKTGSHTIASYWRVPDAALDDGDDLAALARRALAAAREAAARKRPAAKAPKATGAKAGPAKPATGKRRSGAKGADKAAKTPRAPARRSGPEGGR